MNQSNIEFLGGPYDGLEVTDTNGSFKEFYYVPIAGDTYHHYQKISGTYVYIGEVVISKA